METERKWLPPNYLAFSHSNFYHCPFRYAVHTISVEEFYTVYVLTYLVAA